MPDQLRVSLRDALRQVFKRRAMLLVSISLFVIGTFIVSHYISLKYTGKAIFEFGVESAAEQISVTSRDSFGTIKERLVHDLAGYQAVASALEELGLTGNLSRDEEGRLTHKGQAALQSMVNQAMDAVTVEWEARSKQEDLVSISFTHSVPMLAEQMPNILVRGYINRTYERIRSGFKQQHDFLLAKVEDSDKQFEKAIRDKIDFETLHAGMLPESPGVFQEKIAKAKIDLEAARDKHEIASLKLAGFKGLKKQTVKGDPLGQITAIVKQPNPELARLKVQYEELKDELNTAIVLNHMTENHPRVKALTLKVEQLKNRIEQTPTEVVKERVLGAGAERMNLSIATAEAQSEFDTARSDIARLEKLLKEYDKAWRNLAPVRQNYLGLLKKVEDHRQSAQKWQKSLSSVQVALAAAVDNRLTRLKAVQPAQKQFLPSSPSLPMVVTMAVGGGILFGGFLILIAKLLDRTIGTPEDAARHFDMPIHGIIGEIVTPIQQIKRRFQKLVILPAVAVVLITGLTLSSMSIAWRLKKPERYRQFWNSPSGFVDKQIKPALDGQSLDFRE